MRPPPSTAVRTAALVYVAAIAIVILVALVAGISFGERVMDWRRVPFPRLPKTTGEVGSIVLHNGRILLALIGAAIAVNAPWLTSAGAPTPVGRVWKATRALCDALLLLGVGRNLVTVALGLAVYRDRMLLAILPHGPIELAAFSSALALYLLARRGPVARRTWTTSVATGAGLLAVAALLEVVVVL